MVEIKTPDAAPPAADVPPIAPIKPRAPKAPPTAKSALAQAAGAAPLTESEEEALNLRIAELRGKGRNPFGSRKQKLAYPERPGYHRHWFADHPGRIDQARMAGYEHVKDHEGKIVQLLSGKHRDGRAMIGYLMEIPKVIWEEDMAAQREANDVMMDQIKHGVPKDQSGQRSKEAEAYYVPQTGITVKRGA